MNKRNIGTDKEQLAKHYLEEQGVKIIAANYYTYHGEIDLIGMDGEYLCFFEVKYRKNAAKGDPLLSVTPSKIRRIVNSARVFLYNNHYPENTFIRFDCIGILDSKFTWIKNAFSAY